LAWCTTLENADTYEQLLKTKKFPFIAAKNVAGLRKIELIKRPLDSEIEFITIMWFNSLDDVKMFAGKDYERAVVLPEAEALLKRHDLTSQHYTVSESINY
jgi:hypothetical protein